MTRTTPATQTARTAESTLRDLAFVLAMTEKVKSDMGKPTPPAGSVSARRAARKQLAVAA